MIAVSSTSPCPLLTKEGKEEGRSGSFVPTVDFNAREENL